MKTGLVDGYYYGEDGNLFTGSVEQDGKSYKFENGRIVITDDVSYTWKKKSGYTDYGGYYEVVHSIAVDVPESLLTDEIYVDTTAEIANNPGQAFKQVLSASENYVISKVALSSPDFGDGVIVGTSDQLSTIIKGWTKDDLKKYREMDESNTQTIPYIVRSADFVDYLQEVFPNESVTDATKMYMEAFGNNTLTKTYTEYLTNKYGAFNSWTYAKAVDFIKADGDCIEINNNEQQQVEPQLVEFLLKIFHLAAYNDSYVGVYNNDDSVVNGKSIGNFDGVNYSSVFYTYQGYSSLLSYENKNGISAIEIITPGVANCWNGVDVNSPSMRIVLTKK